MSSSADLLGLLAEPPGQSKDDRSKIGGDQFRAKRNVVNH